MPVFVQLMSSFNTSGTFKVEEDNKSINKVLKNLQDNGAKILDVKLSIGTLQYGVSLMYVIMYEAKSFLEI